MNWLRILNAVFPYIEPLNVAQRANKDQSMLDDVAAIYAARWSSHEERALDEAQRVAGVEMERVRTAEGKATTYLAVLAALVPIIITVEAAKWEKKSGAAPRAAQMIVLAVAAVYIAAAGYHAFKALQVTGFERVGEAEIAAAWRTPHPLAKLSRGTLLASRRSRDAVNAKITRIRVTHEHLLRAFATFILLLLLDPLFYALSLLSVAQKPPQAHSAVQRPQPVATPIGKYTVDPIAPKAGRGATPSVGTKDLQSRGAPANGLKAAGKLPSIPEKLPRND